MTMPNSAMIFAAGFGTRMGQLTRSLPKPMIPLAGRPMIDHSAEILRRAGVRTIVANTHHLADKIEPHLKSLDIGFQREQPEILDTGGGLKNALPLLGPQPVITMNPDVCWQGANPVSRLLDSWQHDMAALLLLIPADVALGTLHKGDFSLEHGQVRRNGPYIYSGTQIIRTDRLGEIEDQAFSLNRYWDLLAKDGPIHGLIYDGTWCDAGTPEGLQAAEKMLRRV